MIKTHSKPHFREIEMGKNIQSISRLLQERPRPDLWNEPPLDNQELPFPNPFMASLWIRSGEGLAIKGFGDTEAPNYQVGAHFAQKVQNL